MLRCALPMHILTRDHACFRGSKWAKNVCICTLYSFHGLLLWDNTCARKTVRAQCLLLVQSYFSSTKRHILFVTVHMHGTLCALKTCACVRFTACMGSYCEILLAREKVSVHSACCWCKIWTITERTPRRESFFAFVQCECIAMDCWAGT